MPAFSRMVEPDVGELIRVLLRKERGRRVHAIELFLDEEVRAQLCRQFGILAGVDSADPRFTAMRDAKLMRLLGYDVFRISVASKSRMFDIPGLPAADTAGTPALNRGRREWQEEHRGPIQSMADFERYPWPSVSDVDFRPLEWAEKNLPDGMGYYDLSSHVFELASFLLGYESLCYKVVDDPVLVDALCDKVGAFCVELTRALVDFSRLAVIWGSDDLGFRTSTMMPPAFLREKILPWHRRCAEIAHAKGKPYLLHSCGNLEAITEDLLTDVRIDGRHSFEDAIMPVTEAARRYGSRVALLGGIDMDFICRADEQSVRGRVRETLDACLGDRGGYCLGTGNTMANYVPVTNYLAMLDEGRRYLA